MELELKSQIDGKVSGGTKSRCLEVEAETGFEIELAWMKWVMQMNDPMRTREVEIHSDLDGSEIEIEVDGNVDVVNHSNLIDVVDLN